MRGSGDSLGCGSIFIDERWRIEVDTDGGAKVTIFTTFKNLSGEEQSLNGPYEIQFREEEKPDYFQCDGLTISNNSIPLNLAIQPSNDESITIDLRYTSLAKKEASWWDISLNPRHGAIYPLNLTMECYLPMEAEDIMFRNTKSEDFLIDNHHKTAVNTFNGPPYFFKLAYRLRRPEQLEEQNSIPSSKTELTFTNEAIERVRNSMPLLNFFKKQLSRDNEDKPFLGKTFLIALHFLKDLIIFLEPFEKLGLEPDKTYLFWKPYLYPHKDGIASYLKNEKGYNNIYPLDNLESVLATQQNSMDNILVLEDGGYIVPSLHNGFENILEKTIGAVEQTTKGLRRDKEIEHIAVPILNVAEAEIKTRIEPPFVADAAIHNIENLLPETLRGKKIALMGLGAIGSEILERLKSRGADITPYDPGAIRRIEAQTKKGLITEREAYLAVRDKFLVIGCSGETSIDRSEILSLKQKTYLVSTSSDQVEINIPVLEALSKPEIQPLKDHDNNIIGKSYVIRESDNEVQLLAEGYPVNFWCSDSMPNQVSDIILSVIFLSAFELIVNKNDYPDGINSVDEIVKKYEIAELYEEHYHG